MSELAGNHFWNDRRRKIADILDGYDTDGKTQPAYTIDQVIKVESLFEPNSATKGTEQ